MDYKGYVARVEFDADAGVLFGEVEGLRDVVTFEATDVAHLREAFRDSVDDYLEMCAASGEEPEKPYSGKFLLRLDPRLHREVAMAAARAGKSLNAFASDVFDRWVGAALADTGNRHADSVTSLPAPNIRAVNEPRPRNFAAPERAAVLGRVSKAPTTKKKAASKKRSTAKK